MTSIKQQIVCVFLLSVLVFEGGLAQQPHHDLYELRIVELLQSSDVGERELALLRIEVNDPTTFGAQVRDALISELARTNNIVSEVHRRGGSVAQYESPEYISHLHSVIASIGDDRATPHLVEALGSFGLVSHIALMGERAAPLVIDLVSDPGSRPTAVIDGLIVLRMMLENQEGSPLSESSVSRIKELVSLQINSRQEFAPVLMRTIDVAIATGDPGLRQSVEQLARVGTAGLQTLGVNDEMEISRVQQHVRDRLAGVPALPELKIESE